MFASARRVARAASAAMVFVLAGGVVPIGSIASAQVQNPAAPAPERTDPGWPRDYTTDLYTFTVFEPQVEAWDGTVLTGTSAVAVLRTGATAPEYGTICFTARATIDRDTNLVTVDNTQVTQATFPLSPDNGAAYQAALKPPLAASQTTVTAGRLQTSLVIARAGKAAPNGVDNAPPRIIYSDQPAVLLLIDGAPVLRPAGESLMRVINTRALVLLDRASGTYYLRALGTWLSAGTIEGPWAAVPTAPDRVQGALADLADQPGIDLLEPADGVRPPGGVRVVVSTTPAELIQTQGRVNFVPINATRLLYAQNTRSHLYFDLTDQKFYTLISGRWFRAASLTDGPWEFVDAAALPRDFALIPAEHPTGDTLASVAGTPQAEEAAIANSVPRVAEVAREGLQASATYDGAPDFEPIDGTQMQYAVNTTTPVIRLAPESYYLVDNGVWFTSTCATGPWFVCTGVPPVIYTIPTRHRLHYVTYVRVYGCTPRTVIVGCTPGYYGTVLAPSGCVVYGTGYRYNSYCGGFWAPAPVTYGLGASIVFGAHSGSTIRFGAGWLFGSWWSPCGTGFGWYNPPRHHRRPGYAWAPRCDPYPAWNQHVVWRDTPHSRYSDWGRGGRDWHRDDGSRGHDGGRGDRRSDADQHWSARLPDPPAQHQNPWAEGGTLNTNPDRAVIPVIRQRTLKGIPDAKPAEPAPQPRVIRSRHSDAPTAGNIQPEPPRFRASPPPVPPKQRSDSTPPSVLRSRQTAPPAPAAPRPEAKPVIRQRTPAPQAAPAPAPRPAPAARPSPAPAPKAAPRPAPPPVVRQRHSDPAPAKSTEDKKSPAPIRRRH